MLRRPRSLLFILCSAGFVLNVVQAAENKPAKPWVLQDLLREAVEHSPAIAKARQDRRFAELEEEKNRSLFWPRLRLESTHGLRNQEPSQFKPSESSSASLILSQNLWNEGIDSKKLALARLQKRQAELKFFQQRDELCLKVAQEYYRYSLAVKSLEILKNQQKLIKRQFDLISDEYLHGLRSRRDFLRFKSQSQRAELDLQRQIALIEKSRLSLIALVGLPEDTQMPQFAPEDSPPPLLDLFKNPADLEKTYEGQLLALAQEGYDYSREIAIQQIDPTINFDLRASLGSSNYWNTQNSFASQEQRAWSALVVFNWTLWSSGELPARKAQATVTNEIQKQDIRQRRNDLKAEIQKLQVQFMQLKQNFKTSEELLVLEQNNFLFLEGEYRQSKTTYLDFINGVKDLAEAQNRHWNNLFELKQGIVLYHYYKGSLFRFLLDDYSEAEEPPSEET